MFIRTTHQYKQDPPPRKQNRAKPLARILASLLIVLFLVSSSAAVSAAPSALVYRGGASDKRIALTFDVEGTTGLTTLLQTLKSHNIKSTFFVLGATAEQYPSIVPAIQAGGHEIANHSYAHQRYTKLSRSQIQNDLKRAEQILVR